MDSSNIDAADELIPLQTALRALIPGKKNPSTSWRWISRGLAGVDGERIRLQVWYVGRQPHTTKAAVRQWLEAVTAAKLVRMERTQHRATDLTVDEAAEVGLATTTKTPVSSRAQQ